MQEQIKSLIEYKQAQTIPFFGVVWTVIFIMYVDLFDGYGYKGERLNKVLIAVLFIYLQSDVLE